MTEYPYTVSRHNAIVMFEDILLRVRRDSGVNYNYSVHILSHT